MQGPGTNRAGGRGGAQTAASPRLSHSEEGGSEGGRRGMSGGWRLAPRTIRAPPGCPSARASARAVGRECGPVGAHRAVGLWRPDRAIGAIVGQGGPNGEPCAWGGCGGSWRRCLGGLERGTAGGAAWAGQARGVREWSPPPRPLHRAAAVSRRFPWVGVT